MYNIHNVHYLFYTKTVFCPYMPASKSKWVTQGTALNYTISSMAKSSGKTISKIAKQEEMIKKWNLNQNIQKELLKDLALKKIKGNLKLNQKDFASHFTRHITKYRKRKPKIVLEKVQVSNQIFSFLRFE